MVKIRISNRYIKPDGSVGFQGDGTADGFTEQEVNFTAQDNLVTESNKLSRGHLLLNDMRQAFDTEVAQYDQQLSTPGSALNFDRYKQNLLESRDKIKNNFFQQVPTDGVNGNMVNMLFDDYINTKITSAQSRGREKATYKSKEEFFTAYKQLYNQASSAPEEMVPHYMGQISNLLNDANMVGAFSRGESTEMQRRATKELVKSRVEGLIIQDPTKAKEFLGSSGGNIGLSKDELDTYKQDAASAEADLALTAETQEMVKARIAKQKQLQEYERAKERANRNELLAIDLLSQKGKFTPAQYNNIRNEINAARARQSIQNKEDQALITRIDAAKDSQSPIDMGTFSNEEIDRAIQLDMKAMSQDKGRQLTLAELAGVVGQYKGRVSSTMAAALQTALLSGDEAQMADALEAVHYLSQANPAAITGLPKEQRQAVGAALHEYSTLPVNHQSPEKLSELYNKYVVALSPEGQKQLKAAAKNQNKFRAEFDKKFNWDDKKTQEQIWGAFERDISLQMIQSIKDEAWRLYQQSGGELPSGPILTAAIAEIKQNAGPIPGSADKSIYPNAPGKIFGNEDVANNAFRMINKGVADLVARKEGITQQQASENIIIRPLAAGARGVQTDITGKQFIPYAVYFKNDQGQIEPVTIDGQTLTLSVNADNLNNMAKAVQEEDKYLAQADMQKDALRRTKEQIINKARILELGSLDSPSVQNIRAIRNEISDIEAQLSPESLARNEALNMAILGGGFNTKDININQLRGRLATLKDKLFDEAIDTEHFKNNEQVQPLIKDLERLSNDMKQAEKNIRTNNILAYTKGREASQAIYRLSPISQISPAVPISKEMAQQINKIQSSNNPVAAATADFEIQKRINKQVDALNKQANQSLQNMQQLEQEYRRLSELGSQRTINSFQSHEAHINKAVSGLSDGLERGAKEIMMLSTVPYLSESDIPQPLSEDEKQHYNRVAQFFTAAGANSSPSEGLSLRAVGNHLSKITEAPSSLSDFVKAYAQEIADVLSKNSGVANPNLLIKRLRKSPAVYGSLMNTPTDNQFKTNMAKLLKMAYKGPNFNGKLEIEFGNNFGLTKEEVKQAQELFKSEPKQASDNLKIKAQRAIINQLQDAWNKMLPSVSQNDVDKANAITEMFNNLQYTKGSVEEVSRIITSIGSLLGISTETPKKSNYLRRK